MSLWVAWLARMDLNIQKLGRLPLYSLGLILTFNLGRDITLITLYPIVFGSLVVWWLDRRSPQTVQAAPAPLPLTANQPRQVPAHASLFALRTRVGGFVKRRSL
jgi:hypothetical protein